MGAVSSYPTDTADATDFVLGTDSGGTVKRFSLAEFALPNSGLIAFNHGTANLLSFPAVGFTAPTFTTRSDGTKVLLYPAITGSTVDYAIGIAAGTLWLSVPGSGVDFKFYAGTTVVAAISGTGFITCSDDPFSAGWNSSVQVPTKNAIFDGVVAMIAAYRTILDASGSHIAARVAGTYGFPHGQPLAISGTGTLYSLDIIYLDPADYPSFAGLSAKLRLRCSLLVNDVAPTGNYTIGLHPITRPATSGGAGLNIVTIGAAVAGSTVTLNTPAADSINNMVGSDFALPAAGHYCIGLVTTATVAASSHVHLSAALQLHYT